MPDSSPDRFSGTGSFLLADAFPFGGIGESDPRLFIRKIFRLTEFFSLPGAALRSSLFAVPVSDSAIGIAIYKYIKKRGYKGQGRMEQPGDRERKGRGPCICRKRSLREGNSLSGILHRKHSLRCCGEKKQRYPAFRKGKRGSRKPKRG